ncbi:MAG: lysylphosphatidylglycerol synthase transmembrane domain-containing protein [Sandaracinaceae bacterium]
MASTRSPRRWLFALKAGVSLALLGWLGARMFERDGIEALGAHLTALHPGWIVAAVGLNFLAVFAGVARWRLLLRTVGVSLAPGWLLRSYLVARFVGAFTPSTTGLDGWRLYEAGKESGQVARSATAIGVEKLVGLVGMATVCAALVPFGGLELMGSGALVAAAGLGGGALIGLGLLGRPAWLGWIANRMPGPIRTRAQKLVNALADAELSFGTVTRAVLFGVLSHLSLSAVFMATAMALGVDVPAATLLVVGNAIVLAVLLPVSVGGVGVREGVAVMLLATAGVTSTEAVLVALLGYLTGQLPALLGGVLMAARRVRPSLPTIEIAPGRAAESTIS